MQRDELTQKLLILDAPEHVDSKTNQFWLLRLPTFLPVLVRTYVGTYVQRESKFCFVVLVLVADTLYKILHILQFIAFSKAKNYPTLERMIMLKKIVPNVWIENRPDYNIAQGSS
jgi:hypothetical protein